MNIDREFASKIAALQGAGEPSPSEFTFDPVREHELRSLFESLLPDATADELEKVGELQRQLQAQQARLENLLDREVIGKAEYARSVNDEVARAVRQCAKLLGPDRSRRLLGVGENESIDLVNPEMLEPPAEDLGEVRALTEDLTRRYVPAVREQRRVSKALNRVDPQRSHHASGSTWGRSSKYQALLDAIFEAEEAYNRGDLRGCTTLAASVPALLDGHPQVSDEPLYLASWAYHIGGRGHEKLHDLHSAALLYKASLDLKLVLKAWLSPLTFIATEIKLGAIEATASHLEGVFYLARVEDLLTSQGRRFSRENDRLYRNLLVDSRTALAEAYLTIGRNQFAVEVAEKALVDANALVDLVAETRIRWVISRAKGEPLERVRQKFGDMSWAARGWSRSHPDVVRILDEIGWEPPVEDLVTPPKIGRIKARVRGLRGSFKLAAKKK